MYQKRQVGLLENLNRPSSRNAGSRKGQRNTRKSQNTSTNGAVSHSQDNNRSTLPHVQAIKANPSKLAYSQLTDQKNTTGFSASTSSLPTALPTQAAHAEPASTIAGNNQVYQAASREQLGSASH